MKNNPFTLPAICAVLLFTQGTAQGETPMSEQKTLLCGDKPNCVSTADRRADFNLAPFELTTDNTPITQIIDVALTLPGARLANKTDQSFRIESVSTILRFVDDVEVRIEGRNMIVRSVSRVGYSDFGVNRKRAELFRVKLLQQGLIKLNNDDL